MTISDHSQEVITLITARGGSKGLKNKNILPMCGHPLISWTIRASTECPLVSQTIVTTDSEQIAAVSEQYNASIIKRPAHLASDTSTSDDAISHALSEIKTTSSDPVIALLQPTSPLRTSQHLSEAIELFLANEQQSVIAVYGPKHTPIKAFVVGEDDYLSGLYTPSAPFQARQSLPAAYQPNGAIYLFRMSSFKRENMIPRGQIRPYIMSSKLSIDIDDQYDFDLAESILRNTLNEA